MRAIVFDQPGDESVLRWDESPAPALRPGTVAVDVASTSVNRADLLQRMGLYPPPRGASDILGLELAGTIAETGDGVTGWTVGERVMALVAGGGYAERAVVDVRHLMRVPSAVGLPDAGAVPEVFLTAYLNLIELALLQAGERVLIHGGSGGVGTAAIQMAKAVGAVVWTTAGSSERAARCRALGAGLLGADVAINYREQDFATRLKEAGGADVILDVMGARYLRKNLASLRPDGRLVVIGLQGGVKAEMNLGLALARRLTLIGSTLRGRSDDSKAGIVARFAERFGSLLEDGRMAPIIDSRLPMSQAAEGHRRMARGALFGKLVLTSLAAQDGS